MKQYHMWQAVWMSFYSKGLYRDVAINWGGKTFLYLLFLLALSSAILTYQAQHTFNRAHRHDVELLIEQSSHLAPVMTIKDGRISTPVHRPYQINPPAYSGKVLAVVDVTGRYTTLEQAKTPLLITETKILYKDRNETREWVLPSNMNRVVDPVAIGGLLKQAMGYLWLFLFPLELFFFFVSYIVQVLLYGLLGLLIASVCRIKLSYAQVIQLVMVAITPVVVIKTITHTLGYITFYYDGLIYFFLTMIYLLYGILANKEVDQTE
jgi:hypothetical protein